MYPNETSHQIDLKDGTDRLEKRAVTFFELRLQDSPFSLKGLSVKKMTHYSRNFRYK